MSLGYIALGMFYAKNADINSLINYKQVLTDPFHCADPHTGQTHIKILKNSALCG